MSETHKRRRKKEKKIVKRGAWINKSRVNTQQIRHESL